MLPAWRNWADMSSLYTFWGMIFTLNVTAHDQWPHLLIHLSHSRERHHERHPLRASQRSRHQQTCRVLLNELKACIYWFPCNQTTLRRSFRPKERARHFRFPPRMSGRIFFQPQKQKEHSIRIAGYRVLNRSANWASMKKWLGRFSWKFYGKHLWLWKWIWLKNGAIHINITANMHFLNFQTLISLVIFVWTLQSLSPNTHFCSDLCTRLIWSDLNLSKYIFES